MKFQNIDWSDLIINSKNVYLFFEKYNKFQKIENYYKGEKLKFYAEKHNIEYSEILRLFDIGFENGKQFAQEKTENSLPEYRKDYWFNFAKNHYVTTKLISSNDFHFKSKNFITQHEPEKIIKMGHVAGEYWFVWQEILKNHSVFDPFFKKEIDKIKYNLLTGTPFRFKANFTNLPNSLQSLGRFDLIIGQLTEILIARKEEVFSKGFKNLALSQTFSYQIIDDFIDLFHSFISDTANNKENGTFERHYSKYAKLRNVTTHCIVTLEEYKPLFDFDMSFMYKYEMYGENWFKIIYDNLSKTKLLFDEITNFNNQLIGFTCTLHPDTVETIFNLMVTNNQISGDLNDFQAIFSNTQIQEVKTPIKWLIKSQKKPYRGHQTKLYLFIETMLNGEFSAKEKRKTEHLFIDDKGKFFNSKMKEPNKDDRNTHNIFEKIIKKAKEKTRPA